MNSVKDGYSQMSNQQNFYTSSFRENDVSFTDTETIIDQSVDKTRIMPNSILAKLGLPCQTISDYDYGQCYSYYANGCYNTCQFVDVGDIEDFM